MSAPQPSVKASRVQCQGCGGTGGRHVDPKCPFLGAALERAVPRASKGGK